MLFCYILSVHMQGMISAQCQHNMWNPHPDLCPFELKIDTLDALASVTPILGFLHFSFSGWEPDQWMGMTCKDSCRCCFRTYESWICENLVQFVFVQLIHFSGIVSVSFTGHMPFLVAQRATSKSHCNLKGSWVVNFCAVWIDGLL